MRTSLQEFEFEGISTEPYGTNRPGWNGRKFLHIGIHNSLNKNAGDTVLFPAVRDLFDFALGPCGWEFRQIWAPFQADEVTRLNESDLDAIVIGGGGLLLRGQEGADSTASGWQWNCSVDTLKKIQKPIIVFAVGYNRFRGQEEFDPVFTDHLNALTARSPFVGLRNSGSIREVSSYLRDSSLKKRLKLQSCPTTLAWQIYPQARAKAEAQDAKNSRVLAFNCAFDRTNCRFGAGERQILSDLARALKAIAADGWKLIVVSHKKIDRQIEPYLDEQGVSYAAVDLTNASAAAVLDVYAEVDLAIGLRGHAQLIPFGLRRPILTVISHEKMKYFLEDLGHPEWGVDVEEPGFAEALIEKVRQFGLGQRAETRRHVDQAQARLWEQTLNNFKLIEPALRKPPAAISTRIPYDH